MKKKEPSVCSAENCGEPAAFKAWVRRNELDWTPLRVFLCSLHAEKIEDRQLVAPPFPLSEEER